MNKFELIINNDDLGVTTIENVFINHYMPNSPGDFVKVYLLGLKYCQNNNLSSISNQVIAKSLNILESDVTKAWSYWQKQGIIDLDEKENNYIVRYYNIASLILGGSNKIADNVNKSTEKEDLNMISLFKAVEYMFGRPLSSKELDIINSWFIEFSFTNEMVTLLIEYCIEKGVKDFNYLNKVALNWFDNKIKSYDDAINFIEDYNKKWDYYNKIMKYLGFNRTPSRAEQNIMNKWINEFKMDLDLIYEACNTTLAIDKPNFKYIDTVLTEWYNKKYLTLSDLNNSKIIKKEKTSSDKKVNKMDNQHDYDYDDLEKKIREKMWSEN